MNLKLEPYEKGKKPLACQLIRGFWKAHNAYDEPMEEAEADLKEWTKEGHQLFFICLDEKAVGLVHLGSRGAATDWLEDRPAGIPGQRDRVRSDPADGRDRKDVFGIALYRSFRQKHKSDRTLQEAGL